MIKTKRYLNFIISLILTLVTLTGCQSAKVVSPPYKGTNLSIGVIGKAPDVREKNIRFTNITFNDLLTSDKLSNQFNAIFIMKDHFSQASQSKYAQVYKNMSIPTFFIQSKKSYIPFIKKDLSYKDATEIHDQTYVTGILQRDKKLKYWGYGLYKDTVNTENIMDVYSRIFTTIASLE